ncbi:hypothetical protein N7474_010903 [Penicillium riverlandense]|uniref:uncharacterized protein n=1 Tax=Penicillium riverlandense TaxID=1903569 RepID=UPI0025487664|nr:uncharacterized protein N7474_010903 [Penicillium riverlandense]KAJ5805016.1 hypothetical protein N7474_010903 [Penicillium riverlandense]
MAQEDRMDMAPEGKKSQDDGVRPFPQLLPGPRKFAPQSSTSIERLKKTSMACKACKTAKRKCSGAGKPPKPPCNACKATNTECEFDPTLDLRRKEAHNAKINSLEAKIEELQNYKHLLDDLITRVRSPHRHEVNRVVKMIRMDEFDLEDFVRAVESPIAAATHRHVEWLDLPPQRTVDPYARVTLETLCDIPRFRVPAQPWTKVTDDSYLVSHLISLYLTWDHPCSQLIDQDVFLKHMKAKDLTSEFCTPLLVNSLLAMASVYSDSPQVISKQEDSVFRGQVFLSEAERLWKTEEGRPTLSNVQSLLLICCVHRCQGKANLGWLLIRQAVQLAHDMGLFVPRRRIIRRRCNEFAQPLRGRARQMAMELHKMPNLEKPGFQVSVGDVAWVPYPRLNQLIYPRKKARLPDVQDGLSELMEIVADVQKLFLDNLTQSIDDLWLKAQDPYNRFVDWLSRCPDVSQIEDQPVSGFLVLRLKCLHAIMSLFEMLIRRDEQTPSSNTIWRQEALELQTRSAEETAECLRIHRQSYGIRYIPRQMVGAIRSGLLVLVHQLGNREDAREPFVELWRFGTAIDHRFELIAEAVHQIRLMAQSGAVEIPAEVIEISDPEHGEGL